MERREYDIFSIGVFDDSWIRARCEDRLAEIEDVALRFNRALEHERRKLRGILELLDGKDGTKDFGSRGDHGDNGSGQSSYRTPLPFDRETSPIQDPPIAVDEFVGMSIPDAAEAYLRKVGKPRKYSHIAAALARGGYTFTTKDPVGSVSRSIRHYAESGKRFVISGEKLDIQVGLPEWEQSPVTS